MKKFAVIGNPIKHSLSPLLDWIGFLYSMRVNNINLKNKNCLILGSGGAARAVSYSLSTSNVRGIKVQGRNNVKVKCLQNWINGLYPKFQLYNS